MLLYSKALILTHKKRVTKSQTHFIYIFFIDQLFIMIKKEVCSVTYKIYCTLAELKNFEIFQDR